MQRMILLTTFFSLCFVSGHIQAHILDDLNEFCWVEIWHITPQSEESQKIDSFNPQLTYRDEHGNERSPQEVSKPKTLYRRKEDIRFDDIAGQDTVVAQLKRIVQQFHNPGRLQQFGGRHKKGILLEGPSGTGKTLLARAVANELGFTLHERTGSSFVEIWVGQGAQRVRELFAHAKQTAPSLIFIDEIDALAAGNREDSSSHGDLEYRQTLNEFLAQMNEIEHESNIIVMVATNTIEAVDPAFKSPHRFEIISVGLPTPKGREDILRLYFNRLPRIDAEDAIEEIVEKTKGFSGAQIESLINNAVQLAVADPSAEKVTGAHLLQALEIARNAMKTGMFGSKSSELDKVSFADIAGLDGTVEEFKDLLFGLQHPEKLQAFGVEPPKGILLAGKPGCGKTMLVRALANEANCPVFYASGSSFDGKWFGEGAKKIRDLFSKASIVSPAIIFIDEIDAINLRTGAQQTLNELLTQMDGFTKDQNVIVIGATNMLHEVDNRLRRPGRFSRIITINAPNRDERRAILALYINRLPNVAYDDIPYEKLVLHTEEFNGAALKDLVNDAAALACKENAQTVTTKHFELALDRALDARRNRI